MALTQKQFARLKQLNEQREATSSSSISSAPSFKDRALGRITTAGEEITTGLAEAPATGDTGDILGRAVDATKTAAAVPLQVGFEALPEVTREGLGKLGDSISSKFKFLTDKVASSKLFKEIGDLEAGGFINEENAPELSNVRKTLGITSGLGEISGEILGAEGLAKGLTKGVTAGTQLSKQAAKATADSLTKGASVVSKKLNPVFSRLRPKTYTDAVKSLTHDYKTSFINDKTGVNNKLTKLGSVLKKSPDELINNLSKEGIVPQVEGKLAKFDDTLKKITDTQNSIGANNQGLLKQFKTPTSLDELKSKLIKEVKKTADPAELTKSLAEVTRTIESYRLKYGNTLLPENLGSIRISANSATKAFDRAIFETDVSNAIGRVVGKQLNMIVDNPVYKASMVEWGRLADLKRTIAIFDNQQINVGVLGSQAGRFGGAVAFGAFGSAITGPGGGLVLAGIAATYGGDVVANFLRSRKFSIVARNIIAKELQKQPNVVQQLIDTANEANAKFLQKLLPAPASGAVRTQVGSGETIKVAPKGSNTDIIK